MIESRSKTYGKIFWEKDTTMSTAINTSLVKVVSVKGKKGATSKEDLFKNLLESMPENIRAEYLKSLEVKAEELEKEEAKKAQIETKKALAALVSWLKDSARTPAQIISMHKKMEAEIAYENGAKRPGGPKGKRAEKDSSEAVKVMDSTKEETKEETKEMQEV